MVGIQALPEHRKVVGQQRQDVEQGGDQEKALDVGDRIPIAVRRELAPPFGADIRR